VKRILIILATLGLAALVTRATGDTPDREDILKRLKAIGVK
jgi:hypothetical protein